MFSRTAVLVNGRIFDAPCLQGAADSDAAAVDSSSSSQTVGTKQQERKQDPEREEVPLGRLAAAAA